MIGLPDTLFKSIRCIIASHSLTLLTCSWASSEHGVVTWDGCTLDLCNRSTECFWKKETKHWFPDPKIQDPPLEYWPHLSMHPTDSAWSGHTKIRRSDWCQRDPTGLHWAVTWSYPLKVSLVRSLHRPPPQRITLAFRVVTLRCRVSLRLLGACACVVWAANDLFDFRTTA